MVFKTRHIKPNPTIGQRLANLRKQRQISLEQAEAQTLIRAKYLKALEEDNWRAIPGRVYFLGYLRRYGDYLGLDGTKLTSQFSNEFARWSEQIILPRHQASLKLKFAITPKLIAMTLVVVVVAAMAGYIGYQLRQIFAQPTLVVIAPADELVWAKAQLEIVGRTSQGAVVLINSQNVIQDPKGNFRQTINLQDGLNNIEIIAKSRFNKQTNKTIRVLKTQTSS